MEADAFNEDEADTRFLLSKPACFIVFGKPGSGKTTIARKFARVWKSVLVTVPDVIQDAIDVGTENGKKAQELLIKGEVVSESLCMQILLEKLNSPEVKHHGYVLDGLSFLTSDCNSIDQYLSVMKTLAFKPDYVINLRILDNDLILRLSGVKVDPITNKLYTREYYEKKIESVDQQESEEVGEEDGEYEEENEEDDEEFIEEEELIEDLERDEQSKEFLERLIVRTNEFPENIENNIKDYKEFLLKKIERYISEYDQQKVIELDANTPIKELFKSLMDKVEYLLLSRAVIPQRLQGGEDEEDIAEDLDTEDMLRILAASKMIAPGFRWRRSKWGRLCPVALLEGQSILGKPEFAVSFLDKMYLLSNMEALEKFMKNPRQYLLPPQPAPSCKLVVLGASLSGVTTLCEKLAEKYGCKIVNVDDLMSPRMKQLQEEQLNERLSQLVAECIAKVKAEQEKKIFARKQSISDEEGNIEGIDGDADVEEEETEELVEEEISQDHPIVRDMIAVGEKELNVGDAVLSDDEYVDCLESALLKLYEGTDKGPSSGGWVLDNFPHTREQFNMMVERGIVPEDVIVFRDENNNEILLNRWSEKHLNGASLTDPSKEDEALLQIFKDSLTDFDRHWTGMQTAMRYANNIEPMLVYCRQSEEEVITVAEKKIEGAFQYHGWEYTGMDQDEEEEDFADDDDDEDEEDEDPNKKKAFGETRHFCPVMLKEQHVLWPGSPECAVKYREKVYFLSSSEAKEEFLERPEMYLPQTKPFQLPPVRLLFLGAKGSGKSLHGKLLAKKFGVFHISFKDHLQELIIHKTLKKIGPEFEPKTEFDDDDDDDDDDDENVNTSEDGSEIEGEAENEIEMDAIVFTEFEENIKNNIMENEPLTNETLDAILTPWWKKDPYKSCGFILEGFPRTTEEARYLAANGLFPDGSMFLSVTSDDICDRLMPAIFENWKIERDKRLAAKEEKKQEKLKERDEEKKRRIDEKLLEREEEKAQKAAAQEASGEDEDEDPEEEDEINLEEIVEMEMYDEFGEIEEDDEEEETEEEAVDRIKMELTEKFDEEMMEIESVHETLDELTIPRIAVDAGRKPHITQYMMMKMLKPQVEFRASLFDKCQSVTQNLSKKLLNSGYKLPSRFGRWCPVRLFDGDVIAPYVSKETPCYPVVYRKYLYFLSTEENKERFMQSPQIFLQQSSPKSFVPINLAIIGPPKSGKTSLANRFVQVHGIARLSIGEAIRKILQSHENSQLVRDINDHLLKGLIIPDELAVQALELCLLDPQCVTRGYVLDGYPTTTRQLQLLRERSIIPHKVVHLSIPDQEIMRRGAVDRKSPSRVHPLHDSLTILAIRVACQRKELQQVREFYDSIHQNLFSVDGGKSKWWIYTNVMEEIQKTVAHIQSYIQNIQRGNAASVKYMCITPNELMARLGEFGEYCPVSLARDGQLVDCSSDESVNFVAEFKEKYYKFSSEENLQMFLSCPNNFVIPFAPHLLPSSENLPIRRNAIYVKKMFPIQIELKGYCPVAYLNGNLRYEALIPGESDLIVEYKKKIYSLSSEHCLIQMMRYPKKYSNLTLPVKLPPKREPVAVSGLPMLGYMEQTVSTGIIKALTAVGCLKPKYPFLSAKRSALLYVAYHLKAYNPNASDFVRKKYKKKLESFEDSCTLITYLSKIMRRKYLEPEDRPIDFDHKLSSFNTLQGIQT